MRVSRLEQGGRRQNKGTPKGSLYPAISPFRYFLIRLCTIRRRGDNKLVDPSHRAPHRDASSAVISKKQNWRRNLLLSGRNHESAVNFYIKSRTWWRYRIRGEPHLSAPLNCSFCPKYDRSKSELSENILRKRKTTVISSWSNKVNDFVINLSHLNSYHDSFVFAFSLFLSHRITIAIIPLIVEEWRP